METKSFNLYRYSIPVDSQLILRGRFLKRREGLIVRVACSRDGRHLYLVLVKKPSNKRKSKPLNG